MDLTLIGQTRYRLSGRLTDTSFNGDYGASATGEQPSSHAVIHDFVVEGELEGADLLVTTLDVRARSHPYLQCPDILPSCQALIGQSIASGWRSTVLQALGATSGCTHVTTLLLGLAEARTMAFFLQMNTDTAYSSQNRGNGIWTAQALQVAPGIVGACHVLSGSGSAIRLARAAADAKDDPPFL